MEKAVYKRTTKCKHTTSKLAHSAQFPDVLSYRNNNDDDHDNVKQAKERTNE